MDSGSCSLQHPNATGAARLWDVTAVQRDAVFVFIRGWLMEYYEPGQMLLVHSVSSR